MFEILEHGKGPCDGIGAGLKHRLGFCMKKHATIPTAEECVDYLWAYTKSKPLRRMPKYAFW